jgi:hypothetical protein
VSLPQIIQSDPNLNVYKISLKNFTTYNSWFIVKDDADTVIVAGVPFTIPHGNYTYQRLSKVLQSTIPNTVVQWIQEQNKMAFSFPSSRTLSFDGLGTTLGFIPHQIYSGSEIVSPSPMLPYADPHIFIHLQNITPLADSLILSNHSGEMRVASILGKVLINASPFQLITHQQVLESDGLISTDNTLNALEFFITDSEGNEFIDIPENEMVLTIESLDVENTDMKDIIKEMGEIKQWLKDLVVYKVVGKRTM